MANCAYHPEREAITACIGCGRLVCAECKTVLGGKTYCNPCTEELLLAQGKGETAKPSTGAIAEEKYPHQVATICGYVFAFLGGWVGIGLGIYLLTRAHPRAKFHGKIVLPLAIVLIIIYRLILY